MHEYHKQRLNLEDRPNTQPIIDHQTRDFIFIMKAGVFNIIQEYFAYNATYVLNIWPILAHYYRFFIIKIALRLSLYMSIAFKDLKD